MTPEIQIIGLAGLPEVRPGDDLAALIVEAARGQGMSLEGGDVLVVTQKVVSKAEGRLVDLREVKPSPYARELAARMGKDARLLEVILGESRRIVRQEGSVIITETRQGFVCANAGVDASNVGGGEMVSLLPEDPDRSAEGIRAAIAKELGVAVAVIVSDTFGRPWREGHTNVAVGLAGMSPFLDYVGQADPHGYVLRVSTMAVADELAAAAELVMGKLSRVPVAIVRGFEYGQAEGTARELVRPPERDLFR
ncbi:MAG: coenzyme F420-0:L-glutamate ligase [Chloroflexota bacterium]|nr:coenzyme F420-0:L-glutamate ligase [Chloroflexota bacterium]